MEVTNSSSKVPPSLTWLTTTKLDLITGRFQQKHIENVLRRYIKEYVTCHTCRSPDTILNKETRLFFLQCMTCHSSCSVQTIKTGFQVRSCDFCLVCSVDINWNISGHHREEKGRQSQGIKEREKLQFFCRRRKTLSYFILITNTQLLRK